MPILLYSDNNKSRECIGLDDLKTKMDSILLELSNHIINFTEAGNFQEAELMMDQYIKLSPNSIERYSLEAFIKGAKEDWKGASKIILEGLAHHPLSFDLLYNLGYIYEKQKEYIDAYYIYMKAKYNARTDSEKADIIRALKGLVHYFKGTVRAKDDEVLNIVNIAGIQITVTTKIKNLLKRKELLYTIIDYMDENISTVLEIAFTDAVISKNLNYFGYDITSVTKEKERFLNVIANEWHDNILQPEQKAAKFYHDTVDIDWMSKIPEFDAIIAVSNNNIDAFSIVPEEKKDILSLLLEKTKNQLFIRVSKEDSEKEFSKKELEEATLKAGFNIKVIGPTAKKSEEEERYEICLVEKEKAIKTFAVPDPLDMKESKSTIMEVDMNKCLDIHGAAYIKDFHHFVESLKEYDKNPDITYEKSILKAYYNKFKPKNQEEVIFAKDKEMPKLRYGYTGYPWYWSKNEKLKFTEAPGETREGGNHFFGPNTDKFGAAELRRLIHLYKIFKKQGYHPEMFSDGYISGYLLIKGKDYRFVVTEGQHRVACLAALGYEKIRCRFTFQPQYPKIVYHQDIKKWPQVANGVYSRNMASRIFNRFFEEGVGRDRIGI